MDQFEIEGGAYTSITGYKHFILRPKNIRWWSYEEQDHGLQVIEWGLEDGEFQEPTDIALDASPMSLLQVSDLLFAFGSGRVDAIGVHQLPEEPKVAEEPLLYAHDAELRIEGSYLDVLNYLERLEAMDERLGWVMLEYSAGDWPSGEAVIRVRTLSVDQAWLGV